MRNPALSTHTCLVAALLWTIAAPAALADSNEDSLRLLREQQLQLEQLREQDHPRPSGSEDIAPPPTPSVTLPTQTCLPVTTLRWQGEAPLPQSAREALAQQYSHRCLDEAALNQLLRDSNLILLRAGYITSRVLLRDDAFQNDQLTLTLLGGRISRVQSDALSEAEIAAALPQITAGFFNLRDLEQGLDQLNRLASNQVTAELRPGVGLGESELWLSKQPGRRWQGLAGLNNGGSPHTGRTVASAGLSLDNSLGYGDFLHLAYSRSLSDDSARLTQGISLYASQPWGYWTASASLAHSESKLPLPLSSITLRSRTLTTQPGLRLDRVLHRDGDSLLSAHLGLSRRKTHSTLEDERLDISSPTHSVMEVGLSHEGLLPLPWSIGLSHSRGLRWFGADHDSAATAGLPRAQFEKWRLNLSAHYRHGPWYYLAEATGQYSPHRLPGAEELVVGDGSSGVRGFQDEVVAVGRGCFLRQNLTRALGPRLQPYIGLDAAHGQTPEGPDWLGALTLGLRAGFHRSTLELSVSRGWRQEVSAPPPRLQARFSLSF